MRNGFCILTAVVCCVLYAHTARPGGFSLAPLRFEFKAKPGQTGTDTIRVRNDSERPVSVTLSVNDFLQQPNGQERELEPGTVERGCANWLTISPQTLELGPKEKRKVRITINVPKDATGTYWAFVFGEQTSRPEPRTKTGDGYTMQVLVKPRWCIRVHLTVPGTEKPLGRITDMDLAPAGDNTPWTVSVEFENTGNALLRCKGRVEFRNENGETVKTALLKKNGLFNVYPGGKRAVAAVCPEKLPPGPYVALAIVDCGGEDLIAGELQFEVK